jgi:VWFA-related protein
MFRRFHFTAILLVSTAAAQKPIPPDSTIPTFSATSRLVYVDVIVRDSAGHIVRNLTQPDFFLFEDGNPQKLEFFSAHSYNPPSTASDPKPASNFEFSNITPERSSDAITVLLFDLLNTPPSDQLTAREQMLKFLDALPRGQRISLFVLTKRLQMIQSFTGSPELLTAAAKMLKPMDLQLIPSQEEVERNQATAGEFAKESRSGHDPGMPTAMQRNIQTQDSDLDVRTPLTISALSELARNMSGYQGRKNLFWVSESFPLALNTTQNFLGQTLPVDARRISNLLASARIAVYPVSVLGLECRCVGKALDPKFFASKSLKASMDDIAQQTGGEAIVENNDLAGAMRRSIEDGSSYYTLAYSPSNRHWNGKFRQLRVELHLPGYSVIYRRGYFATPDTPAAKPAQELIRALQPDIPESTMLQLHARIQLPSSRDPSVHLDSVILPANIGFSATAEGRHHAQLLVVLIALNDGEQQAAAPPQTSGTLTLDFTDEQYKLALSSGIPIHQQIVLKPGKYRLRLGVIDLTNQSVGTLDIPANVEP